MEVGRSLIFRLGGEADQVERSHDHRFSFEHRCYDEHDERNCAKAREFLSKNMGDSLETKIATRKDQLEL